MDFSIKPYESVGPIKLGMTQGEVSQAMGSSILKADYFEKCNISVHYNDFNRCYTINLGRPANPKFQKKSLLNGDSFNKLYQWFKSMDDTTILGDIQLVSFKFGISLFTPSIKTHGTKRPTEVMIFEQGFFDDLKTSALLDWSRKLG
jgi:hypothetical protein